MITRICLVLKFLQLIDNWKCKSLFNTTSYFLQDWLDIDFGLSEGVDFIAVSFVKSSEVINHLKKYLATHPHDR